MATYMFDDLDDLGVRGRVFYEMFPGTAASDAWWLALARPSRTAIDCRQRTLELSPRYI